MNEQIKELLAQALQNHYGDPVDPILREKAIELVSGWGEKFAELIVKECVDIANKNRTAMEMDRNTHLTADAIKEHFGVEE